MPYIIAAAIAAAAGYITKDQLSPETTVQNQTVNQGISTNTLLTIAALGVGSFLIYRNLKK